MPKKVGRPTGWRMDPAKKRVSFSTRIDPITLAIIKQLATSLGLSQGKLIDKVVKLANDARETEREMELKIYELVNPARCMECNKSAKWHVVILQNGTYQDFYFCENDLPEEYNLPERKSNEKDI